MTECEAHRRNKQALYEIELAWGNGIVDLGKLKGILAGRDAERCETEVVGS
ncbi:hypothetical protein AB0O52_17440 [Arthrobacter sp. NPDC080073]|uniref:hypothetical protein n=1 Tax=Arthrobacter sp. NPDC080073 TaxID=3155919 RepID=UPI003431D1C8